MNKANRAFKKALEKELLSLSNEVIELKKEYDKGVLASKVNEFKETGVVATKSELAIEAQLRNEAFIAENASLSQEMDMLRLFIRVYNNEIPVFDDFATLEKYIDRYEFSESDKADIIAFFLNKYYNFMLTDLNENYSNLVRKNILNEVGSIESFPPKRALMFHRQWVKFNEDRESERNKLSFFRKFVDKNGEIIPSLDALTYHFNLLSLNAELSEKQVVLLTEMSLKRALRIAGRKVPSPVKSEVEQISSNFGEKNKLVVEAQRSLCAYLSDDMPLKYLDDNAQCRVFELLDIIGCTPNRKAKIKRNILESNKKIIAEYNLKMWEEAQEMFLSENEKEFLGTVEMAIETSDRLAPFAKKQLYELFIGVKNQLVYCYKLRIEGNLDMNEDGEYLLLLLQELAENFDMHIGSNYKQVLGLK